MKRQIIKIDEDKCTGCGVCIPNCHEGALQMIDGKARLISDLMCDGLGACIGHCPEDAIEIEEREAQPYDEILVIKEMVNKGENTVIAHLKHLKDHKEFGYLKQGVRWLQENADEIDFDVNAVISVVHNSPVGGGSQENHHHHNHDNNMKKENDACGCGGHDEPAEKPQQAAHSHAGGGCPGSMTRTMQREEVAAVPTGDIPSQLTHWPVQMHLINPGAAHFKNSDLVLSADCVAFSHGDFHSKFLKGKTLAIACPKLDSNMEVYVDKLVALMDHAEINTLSVLKMEVPCCGGLLQIAQMAAEKASRKVPIKSVTVGIDGSIKHEAWV